jgi:tRNA A37 methylthiotransferase MiaB
VLWKRLLDHVGAFASPGRARRLLSAACHQVAAERLERLPAQTAVVVEKNRSRVGEAVDVLIDGPDDRPGVSLGRTATQAPDVDPVTHVRGRLRPGTFVAARITGSFGLDLTATPIR